jgi:hypothetical protein
MKWAIWCLNANCWLEDFRDVPVRLKTRKDAERVIKEWLVHAENYEVRKYED